MFKKTALTLLITGGVLHGSVHAQQALTLKQAVETALANYGSIKAKQAYARASEASVTQSKREYLPDLNLSAQQDYGTVNGLNGPSYGYRGLSTAASGPSLPSQNWNAAFGALYLANISWDFYSFGKAKEKINVAKSTLARDKSDLNQEMFQHEVKVAAAYLNLLATQRLVRSWQNNLDRATRLREVVVARALNGLIAGVDSSQANAELSSARITLTKARDAEQEQSNQLAVLMGVPSQEFALDTVFINKVPTGAYDTASSVQQHPLLQYYQSRIALSNQQAKYYHKFNYPTFSAFGLIQGRGSGFDWNYGQLGSNLDHYTSNYWDGVQSMRGNYLVGLGMIWNLTTPLRIKQQVSAQKATSLGLQAEYTLADQQLKAQLALAGNKMKNALSNYAEAPIQVKSASDAYHQKEVLYTNGLSNIVEVTQALYLVNRSETDRDIAYTNVWQALLLKAAASGNFDLFLNEF
ncbi:Outer membrane protein TolC [Filimonas lacunae]|uniref:Outer membrane protein TolC n=1 Tax=Filimonas lacunae TaxID=477680 RepID=A0A173MK16_9BACT|nr:TolC family protein [Filimonas lacunae]BAV07817.1 outer membrane protein-like protein [Filimonas lacunae]SIT05170.1 Outer membrane protein TolC [Filimonas lacunae]